MVVLLCILSFVIILIAFVLFVRISVTFKYDEKVYIAIKVIGINIPVDISETDAEKESKKVKKSEEVIGENKWSKMSVSEKIYTIRYISSKTRLMLNDFLRRLTKRLFMKELSIKVRIGTGNAMTTAIETGVLWGISGMILATICNNIKVDRREIDIIPDFNREIFAAYVLFNMRFRIISVLSAIISILWKYKSEIKDIINIFQKKGNSSSCKLKDEAIR